jgi:hypothetical protein
MTTFRCVENFTVTCNVVAGIVWVLTLVMLASDRDWFGTALPEYVNHGAIAARPQSLCRGRGERGLV